MRKLIVAEFMSLDGVIEEPAWTTPYWTKEIADYKLDELSMCGTLVLGRVTYEGFAATWPGRKDEAGYADRMNNTPKIVISKTLKNLEWNRSTQIRDNAAQEILLLKKFPGRDMIVFGSSNLIETFMHHDLVDEYRLLIFPLVLGGGKRLFKEGQMTSLKLVDSRMFSSGVAALVYQPDHL